MPQHSIAGLHAVVLLLSACAFSIGTRCCCFQRAALVHNASRRRKWHPGAWYLRVTGLPIQGLTWIFAWGEWRD